ncbi:SDR family NAD(P)-dependent oxidoreductase [Kribbella solani]|uniref:NAD(P)-dependent dehydrogenase (Short-subunit alcohol dehydrogenase family) n=1 Tax=Kribbella solani TaxID=236067 RepID=A0A841DT85_9ACTN|nr:SDR family oxidoreductase [Kribbella solani]MBB5978568.1 NAD(P)-dependent dehydrogenase (short-subunit alcohol dehydrogenase family) [Kribbella solani]
MNRSVLVTGASRGIGAATARAFAEAGDRVAIHYGASADAAAQLLKDLPGTGHVMVQADLADPAATEQMVDDAARALGSIDVLVNNAAVYHPHRIRETTYAEWQQAWTDTLSVNLLGPANTTWCAVRHMPRGGRIINVSSRGAFRGEPNQPAYGASKAALVSLTQSLARALGPEGIAVTAIAPGWTLTDMAAPNLTGPDYDRRRLESPLERIAAPTEVAAAILYLASPAAEFATGTILDFNGASHLRM